MDVKITAHRSEGFFLSSKRIEIEITGLEGTDKMSVSTVTECVLQDISERYWRS